jgi:hypothetical protein
LIKLFITWGITVCDGVDFLEDDEETTSEQLQKNRNTQAITILNSSVEKKEFN